MAKITPYYFGTTAHPIFVDDVELLACPVNVEAEIMRIVKIGDANVVVTAIDGTQIVLPRASIHATRCAFRIVATGDFQPPCPVCGKYPPPCPFEA